MTTPEFSVVLRGYDRTAVDKVVAMVEFASAEGDPATAAAARQAIDGVAFGVEMRGYDIGQIDRYLAESRVRLAKIG